ncbi:protein phosphatase 2C 57 [Rosa sericea]
MALLSPQLQRFLLTKYNCSGGGGGGAFKTTTTTNTNKNSGFCNKSTIPLCSAIAIDAPGSSSAAVAGVRWGSTSLQGAREEMEDGVVVRSDGLDGYSFAAVFDGHAGFSSVKFLRDELYKECCAALQGGLLLSGKDIKAIREALQEAFEKVDAKLLDWLERNGEEDESGSTATVMFVGNDMLFISHVGDSSVVQSCSGKAEVLTGPHRPYGSNKVCLQEIKRIREAGGWIVNGRICGDIAVSRAFGDMRFKTKKNEMLKKGVEEGRWTEKFVSRVQFSGDLVTASPDVYQASLGADSEFLVLASDGLWDYINSSDAVSFVRNQLRQHGDVQLACDALAEAALDRKSQDNISIVIADLGRTDWQRLPFQQQNVVYEFGQAFATIGLVSLGIWMSTSLLSS